MPVTVDVRTLRPLTVACLRHVGTVDDIDGALQGVLAQARNHGLVVGLDSRPVRLCQDPARSLESGQRQFDAGVIVPNPSADCGPLARTEVRGGTYAVALHRGPHAGVTRTYRWLLESWLPESGYAVRSGPSVEVYLNDPATTPEADLMTEIRLPVRPAS